MPVIALNDETYKRFKEFKEDVVSMDVFACRDLESETVVSFFWNDERLINFMLEVMSAQLLKERIKFTCGQNHVELGKDQRECLR